MTYAQRACRTPSPTRTSPAGGRGERCVYLKPVPNHATYFSFEDGSTQVDLYDNSIACEGEHVLRLLLLEGQLLRKVCLFKASS